MCNLSWTPHSNLEKDNSLKTTPVLAKRWAVWSILSCPYMSFRISMYTSSIPCSCNDVNIAWVCTESNAFS